MNILVVDIAAEHGGAISVLTNFYNFIKNDETAKKHHWKLIVSISSFQPVDHISIEIIQKGKHPWTSRLWSENKKIKRIAEKFRPDCILSLQNTIINGIGKTKQAVYVHQSIPFQRYKNFSFLKKNEFTCAIYQHIIGRFISYSVRKADQVFVQTEWMKNALIKKTKCNGEKITTIPINYNILPNSPSQKNWNNKSFFYPAFYAIYKNQDLIVEAAEILRSKGIKDISIILTTNCGIQNPLIKEVGKITHKEVLLRLSESTLIFPSYIETVGLPLIESMSMGGMILAADCEYAHETLGQYNNVCYFNPFNPSELANLIECISNGKIIIKDYSVPFKDTKNSWNRLLEKLEEI